MKNIILYTEATRRDFGKVSGGEYIGDMVEDILLANASRSGEIWLKIMGK